MAIVYFFLEVNFQTKSLSIPRGGVGRASFSVCCFVFLYFFFILENRTLPALFCLLSGAPQLPTHTRPPLTITVHVEIFLIVRSQSSFVSYRVRCDPTEKKSRDRFLYSFLCVCVRLWPEDILQHRRNGRNRRRKMWKKTVVCVWQWLTKVVTVEQFNWFIISRADYSPIAFNPTSWIVAIL